MSTDGSAEQENTLFRARSFCGGRVFDYVPDDAVIIRYPDALKTIKPYLVVTFAPLYPTEADTTIGAIEDQPQVMGAVIECWAATGAIARSLAGEIRNSQANGGFLGWAPSAGNATPYQFGRGAGSFNKKDSTGRPTRFCETVPLQTILNMATV